MGMAINRPKRQGSPVEAKPAKNEKKTLKKGLQTQAMLAIYLQKQMRPGKKTKK